MNAPCRTIAPAVYRYTPIMCLFTVIVVIAACETPAEIVSRREDHLAAAGFLIRPANTPEREAMLQRLPASRFVRRLQGDNVNYVYADPLVCNCLYVGSQQAYNRFKSYQQQQHLADQQQMIADTYADVAWNWSAWGPWPYGFRYGPGVGW